MLGNHQDVATCLLCFCTFCQLSWPYRLFWLIKDPPNDESEDRRRGILSRDSSGSKARILEGSWQGEKYFYP